MLLFYVSTTTTFCNSLWQKQRKFSPRRQRISTRCCSCVGAVRIIPHRSTDRLTIDDHRNAEKSADASSGESEAAGPSTPGPFPLHQERTEQKRRNVYGSGDECVDEDVAMQIADVQCQCVVDEAAREPEQLCTAVQSNITRQQRMLDYRASWWIIMLFAKTNSKYGALKIG